MERFGSIISRHFLRIDESSLHELGIIAVVLGGSVVYHHAEHDTLDETHDLDMALFVLSKSKIVDLLQHKRRLLMRVLRIHNEEHPDFQLPTCESSTWEQMDGVRFAGRCENGTKKSVKILSLESFRSPPRLNILSYKDRRVYGGYTLDGVMACSLQQVTKLESGLVMLHDPWLFEGKRTECGHRIPAAFGVTADLLMTGLWFFGEDTVGRDIRQNLIDYASKRCKRILDPRKMNFARSPRFGTEYRAWLDGHWQLSANYPDSCDECNQCLSLTGCPEILYGPTPDPGQLSQHRLRGHTSTLGPEVIVNGTDPDTPLHSNFSSNSTNSIVSLFSGGRTSVDVFCKRTSSSQMDAERDGAREAKKFFPHIQYPRKVGPCLFYPLFKGCSEAELQLDFIKTGDHVTKDLILDTEMRKAEDTLRAYCGSLRSEHNRMAVSPSIDRFFHNRLREDRRLKEFYGAGLTVSGQVVPLDTMFRLKLCINGSMLPPLRDILDSAMKLLDCSNINSIPLAFGLGDGHGGNVMVDSKPMMESSQKILYIDYEVSGFHSPLLDIAKPLYNDVFFRALYADCLPHPPQVRVEVENDTLFIHTVYGESSLSRAILEIKRYYLVEPLFQYASEKGLDLEQDIGILTSALLACGILTRNYHGKEDVFFTNLSISAVLSQAKSLKDIWRAAENILTQSVTRRMPISLAAGS